jgi:crossover junction endodeoxyribonuclease RuvC
MARIIVGIDPGITGGIATLYDGDDVGLDAMPVFTARSGKQEINPAGLYTILEGADEIWIEQVGAMPGQGVTSMFNFGKSLGIIIGVSAGLQIPYNFVTPQSWKKAFGLINSDKDYARSLMIQKYPALAHRVARKKDGGIADAFWIAQYGKFTGKAAGGV